MLQSSRLAPFSHIIEKMKDPEKIRAFIFDPANRNPDPIIPYYPEWNDLSLASGYPGLLLFFATLKDEFQNSDAIAHQYVLKIKDTLENEGCTNFSLFSGISGVCFSLEQISCLGTRYRPMINSLDKYLLDNIKKEYLDPIQNNITHNQPTFIHLYDPIQGICGIGRYVLEFSSKPHFSELTQTILEILIKLCHPLKLEKKNIHGWYVSPHDPLKSEENSHSKGSFNLGLAHGVTGILAFLAIAKLRGFEVEGQKEIIDQIATWICEQSIQVNENIQWPYEVAVDNEQTIAPSKDAWCYGVPGIARTLFLAGKALGNQGLKDFAIKAFKGIFARAQDEWGLPGPNLCHGIAGLLLITHLMAQEEEGVDLSSKVEELEQILLSFYIPNSPFGFKDPEPCQSGKFVQIDRIGFLEGSIGILLTLNALANPKSQFHLPLMIHA